jgi:hypothetical protein
MAKRKTPINTGFKFFGYKVLLERGGDKRTDKALKEAFRLGYHLAGMPASNWAVAWLLKEGEKQ